MTEDPLQVRLEESGTYHFDGRNENGRFSGNLSVWRIVIGNEALGTVAKLAEAPDRFAVLDRSIARVETMLTNLRRMRQAQLESPLTQ